MSLGRATREWSAPRPGLLDLGEGPLSAAKWLAMGLMVVDHANRYLLDGAVPWMFAAGRISMPLFAVVLGCNLARPGMVSGGGYRRMALRLTAFGLLATAPFMALNKLPAGWWPLNMMFTFLVAVVAVWLVELRRPLATIVACLVVAWGGALGEYWWPAVGLCMFTWAYRVRPSCGPLVGFLACLALLRLVNGNHWALAAVPLLLALRWWPMVLPRAKWGFYAFYPVHLGMFWLILLVRK